jgi:hypothetical protein
VNCDEDSEALVLMIDQFLAGPRDPRGMTQANSDELVVKSLATRPADKPLTLAALDSGEELTAYVDALAVGTFCPTPH